MIRPVASEDDFATLYHMASGIDPVVAEILALHRPDFDRDAADWNDPDLGRGPACQYCIDENGCGAEWVRWPCDTAQLIIERMEAS